MSHFVVAVLSHQPEDVEALLEPFCECPDDAKYLEMCPADESIDWLKSQYELKQAEYATFEDFLQQEYGYEYCEELDEAGYMANPNARWDWWSIGGRWPGLLKLKSGCRGEYGPNVSTDLQKDGRCDIAQIKDVDFSPDPQMYAQAVRFWEVHVEGSPLAENETAKMFHSLFAPQYIIDQYHDKEAYARQVAGFDVWALVTPDGEWREKGQMGWFAVSDATHDSRVAFARTLQEALESADPNLYITIVDCHI